MKAKIRKWGNSLALRIPFAIAKRIRVKEGDAVELSVSAAGLTIKPSPVRPALDDFLSGVTPGDRHESPDWRTDLGRAAMIPNRSPVPERGAIGWFVFDPQAGRRPALVLSHTRYNEKTGPAVSCPITSRVKGHPFDPALPADSPRMESSFAIRCAPSTGGNGNGIRSDWCQKVSFRR